MYLSSSESRTMTELEDECDGTMMGLDGRLKADRAWGLTVLPGCGSKMSRDCAMGGTWVGSEKRDGG